MPSATPRRVIPKESFNKVFSTLKTQAYHDPGTRGPGSHTHPRRDGFSRPHATHLEPGAASRQTLDGAAGTYLWH
ncbi:hypothetical protein KEM55_002002 [Ascosphaera atra]|nr:hypothetical protein KEM55_002002 [Ascosphaera atra]